MPQFDFGSDGSAALRVPGLYAALLARERDHQESHDRFAAEYTQYRNARDRRALDALEAGLPALLQGRRLKGWGLPQVPLRREQAFDWFAVSIDDSVVPTESPDDGGS